MVSHGREKETKPKRTKKKGGKDKSTANNGTDDHADDMKDMELPDDFSIFGGSSVASSNIGFDDGSFGDNGGEYEDEDGGGGGLDADRAETAAMNRASRLADALALASTLTSEKRSAKREGGYRILFKAITQYAAGAG